MINQVHRKSPNNRLTVKVDVSWGFHAIVAVLLAKAEQLHAKTPEVPYAGAALQHLVGATLDRILGRGRIDHKPFRVSDASTIPSGRFDLGDVVIHVTVSPTEALMRSCTENLADGLSPVIITTRKNISFAQSMFMQWNIFDKVEVFDVEQFIAVNIYLEGRFDAVRRNQAVREIVDRYNEIVEEFETHSRLRIALQRSCTPAGSEKAERIS